MILGYAARNAVSPKVNPDQIAKFRALAHQQDPGLKAKMPLYTNAVSQIASRIEGLDADRRRAAHEDLNQQLLGPVSTALRSGQTAPAVTAIGEHLKKLAGQYGVPVPPGV